MKMKEIIISMYAAALLFFSGSLRAQVTIGGEDPPQPFSVLELISKGTSGLRLPQMTTGERNTLTGSADFASEAGVKGRGLVIYNTTSDCIEYWNSKQWISLCEGSSKMTVWPEPPKTIIDADGNMTYSGGGNDIEDHIAQDPDTPNGPFSYVVMLGSEYATATDEYNGEGLFKIHFQPNNSTHPRSAIVRITNGATGLYKDFLFTQEGQTCSRTMAAPTIHSIPSTADKKIALCKEGAVYLWVRANTPKLDSLIWTRNGAEIARGVNHITVTQPGDYNVYMGLVGCNDSINNAVTVSRCDSIAPHAVTIVVAGNNGKVCGSGGEVTLWARKTGSGNVIWFKDGVLEPTKTGESISAGVGTWFAVVEGSGNSCLAGVKCYSVASEEVLVSVDPDGSAPQSEPSVDLDGGFCEGSTKTLRVNNPLDGYLYTWYADNTEIGADTVVTYSVPKVAQKVIIRCRVTKSGYCAAEKADEITINPGTDVPAKPAISGNKSLCEGVATLYIVPSGVATNFAWYKDGKKISTEQYLDIYEGGDYSAAYSTGGCYSAMTDISIPLDNSVYPEVTITPHTANVTEGNPVTFSVKDDYGIKKYEWSVDGSTTSRSVISGGKLDDNTITVKFITTGTYNVTLVGSNNCDSDDDMATVIVAPISTCNTTVTGVTPSANTSVSAILNKSVTLSVSATLSNKEDKATYQWYSTTTPITTAAGGTAISNATKNAYIAPNTTAGTVYYYCAVSTCGGNSTMASGVYKVTATALPTAIGSATFTGRTSFDIAETNCSGTPASRQNRKTNFNLRTPQDPYTKVNARVAAPYTGVQVYTLTPKGAGAISNVRFYFDDPNQTIDSIAYADYSTGSFTEAGSVMPKVTVYYKASLQTSLVGVPRANALKTKLYAVYTSGSNDYESQLTIHFQDCGICGAYTDYGGWLTFMCYNLGANETLDPFKVDDKDTETSRSREGTILGDLFQWGRRADGHEKVTSGETKTRAGNPNPAVPNPDGIGGKFILVSSTGNGDWSDYSSTPHPAIAREVRWGHSVDNYDMPKGANDPCPEGWKVPSKQQWRSIFSLTLPQDEDYTTDQATANKWVRQNNGYMVGDALFLPFANARGAVSGFLREEKYNDRIAFYWSSTMIMYGGAYAPYHIFVANGNIGTGNASYKNKGKAGSKVDLSAHNEAAATGMSVRCVAE